MKSFRNFIKYLDKDMKKKYDIVECALREHGFEELIKKSGNNIRVLTDDDRMAVMCEIESILKVMYPQTFYESTMRGSSIGGVNVEGMKVHVSPKNRQGNNSAGKKNEIIAFRTINKALGGGQLDIIFHAGSKKFVIKNAISVENTSSQTQQNKKADIVIKTTDGVVPLSIKKVNAEYWESLDRHKTRIKPIIDSLLKTKKVKLVDKEKYPGEYNLVPNVAWKASVEEKQLFLFGSDIMPRGAIIVGNFNGKYEFSNDLNIITIKCSNIYISPSEMDDVYVLVRNQINRNRNGFYPGLRIVAVERKRINKTVYVINKG